MPAHRSTVTRANGKLTSGFTLIEMLVVMTLIGLLLMLAAPRYFATLDNGRLHVQRQNLATIRDAIDKFYADQGKYPDTLDDLVAKRYLRQLPIDPLTEAPNWTLVAPQDPALGAVYDVQPAPKPEASQALAATVAPQALQATPADQAPRAAPAPQAPPATAAAPAEAKP